MSLPRIIIIGGGVTGLAVTFELLARRQAGAWHGDALLLEATHRTGGVIRTTARAGYVLEGGPDSLLNDRPEGVAFCRRLGLAAELWPTNPQCRRSFVVQRGRLLPVPEGFSLLGPAKLWPFAVSPALSVAGKLRALGELLVPARTPAADESVASFVRRRFGREVLDALAEPMVRGIASDDPARLSMRALLPQFLEMEQREGSVIRGLQARARRAVAGDGAAGPRYGLFVSLRRGMQQLVDALAAQLPPGVVRPHARVLAIERASAGGWQVRLEDGETLAAQAVCLAVPAHAAASLVRGYDPRLAEQFDRIPYASWMTVNLAYPLAVIRHHLNGFGCVVPSRERSPITGCTFMHVKFTGRAPVQQALLRAFLRYDQEPALAALDDAGVIRLVHRRLASWLSIASAPQLATVHRSPQALPQYRVGHLDRVAAIRRQIQAHPGLAIAGNAYAGHGVTACVRSAAEAAAQLAVWLRPQEVCP